jgi:MFS family permease
MEGVDVHDVVLWNLNVSNGERFLIQSLSSKSSSLTITTIPSSINHQVFLVVILPMKVAEVVDAPQKGRALGLLYAVLFIIIATLTPIAGWLSDRTFTRWGRRYD